MDLATAQLIVAQGSRVDRSTWNHAQQTALWLLDRGETPMVLDSDAALQEAVALYKRELERQAAQRNAEGGGTCATSTAAGPDWIEANTGWGGRRPSR